MESKENKKKNRLSVFIDKIKPRTRMDAIRLLVLAISIPVFIYSAGQLVYRLYRYGYEDKQMENVVGQKPVTKNPFEEIPEEEDKSLYPDLPYLVFEGKDSYLNDGILAQYRQLYSQNEDLAGWMIFPGFDSKPIDYPIVYSGDNDFYLHRDFNKNDSYAGSLFFDGNNTPYHDNPMHIDRNYVIYGHAMKNKSMFGHLTDYWGNEEALKNTTIYMDLLNTRLEYEVIATFLVAPNFNYRQINFLSDQEYLDYLQAMVDRSDVDFGAEVNVNDKIITLSTCYKSTRRTAIIAKLVSQVVYSDVPGEDYKPDEGPVALPTHIPMEMPSPTPRVSPDPESDESEDSDVSDSSEDASVSESSQSDSSLSGTSGVSPPPSSDPQASNGSKSPGSSSAEDPKPTPPDEPEPSPAPTGPKNLIKNPKVDEGAGNWLAGSGADFSYDEEIVLGASSGKVTRTGEGSFSAYQDVTDILKAHGSGRYSVVASINALGQSDYFRFILELEFAGEGTGGKVRYISGNYLVNSSNGGGWVRIGANETYLYLSGYPDQNVLDLEGKELLSAHLHIESVNNDLTSFNFDEVRLFKEGVQGENPALDPEKPDPTPIPTPDPEESDDPDQSSEVSDPDQSEDPEDPEDPDDPPDNGDNGG